MVSQGSDVVAALGDVNEFVSARVFGLGLTDIVSCRSPGADEAEDDAPLFCAWVIDNFLKWTALSCPVFTSTMTASLGRPSA